MFSPKYTIDWFYPMHSCEGQWMPSNDRFYTIKGAIRRACKNYHHYDYGDKLRVRIFGTKEIICVLERKWETGYPKEANRRKWMEKIQ